MKILYSLLLVSVISSGCVRTAAKTTPDAPPLDVPAPPPRDVEPSDVEMPQPVPLVPEPARSALPPRARPAPREQPARSETPKPEPPKPEPPPVEEPLKTPSTLQTTPATAEGEVERGIRASLAKATADLNRIDYRVLNADAKTQYDTAKRFIRQADDAMRVKNLVFAKNLADKAAALAVQLGAR